MVGPVLKRWALGCGAGLAAATLAACGESTPASAAGARPPAPNVDDRPAPVERLAAALAALPAADDTGRNPFRFGSGRRSDGQGPRPMLDPGALPELPLPLPKPALRVLGVASDPDPAGGPPVRTAILSVGGELVLAPEGALVAGRYRVKAIGERDVVLVDQIDQHVQRLALR